MADTPGYAAARDQLTQIASRLQQMADTAVPPAGLNALTTLKPSSFNTGAAGNAMGPFNMQSGASTSLLAALTGIGVSSPTFIKGMAGSMDWNQQLINRSLDQLEQIEQEYSTAFQRAGNDVQAQQRATQTMQRKLGAIANQIPRSARALSGPQ